MVSLEQRVERIDAALPQTQCQQCGYPRCREYAHALAQGNTDIDRCPPGGSETIERLSQLLNTAVLPLNTELGEHRPPVVARIREHECIGCTLCIQTCPTDAIIGAAKLMHTVAVEDCTGCELCLPVCPVDCIDTPRMDDQTRERVPTTPSESSEPSESPPHFAFYRHEQVARYRWLTERRVARLEQNKQAKAHAQSGDASGTQDAPQDSASMRQDIAAAVARRRAQRVNDNDVK